MNKYRELARIGDGAFGSVVKAEDIATGEVVAIKLMRQQYSSWEECVQLRELQSLQQFSHVNIVRLKEIIRENSKLAFVFEFLGKNVLELYQMHSA